MTKVTLVYRDQRFSPRSVAKDALILETVGRNLQARGLDVAYVGEADLQPDNEADLYLTMMPCTCCRRRNRLAGSC